MVSHKGRGNLETRTVFCVFFTAGLTILTACAHPSGSSKTAKKSAPEPNFEIVVYEVVQNAEEDGISATEIYIDGAHAGRTEAGRKSVEKKWSGIFPAGNRLVRFERWLLPGVGPWTRADAASQPAERFFLVRPGERTVVKLKYYGQGRRYSYEISREPLP